MPALFEGVHGRRRKFLDDADLVRDAQSETADYRFLQRSERDGFEQFGRELGVLLAKAASLLLLFSDIAGDDDIEPVGADGDTTERQKCGLEPTVDAHQKWSLAAS